MSPYPHSREECDQILAYQANLTRTTKQATAIAALFFGTLIAAWNAAHWSTPVGSMCAPATTGDHVCSMLLGACLAAAMTTYTYGQLLKRDNEELEKYKAILRGEGKS